MTPEFRGLISITDTLVYVDLGSDRLSIHSKMAGKRPCDEIEMGSVEHVEPAMAGKRHCNGLEMGSAEHEEWFLAGVVLVKECRGVRNKLVTKRRDKSDAWCRANSAELATAHSNLDEAFVEAAKRSVGIQFESLTPPVHDMQWKPLSKAELKRKLAARAASASGSSTPSGKPISAAGAMKQLDSSTRPCRHDEYLERQGTKSAEQIERENATRALLHRQQRRHDADLNDWLPANSSSPQDRALQKAVWERLSVFSKSVFDCTSNWIDTADFWNLVRGGQLPEFDRTSDIMRQHFEIVDGGVAAKCVVWNVGGNPGFAGRAPATIEHAVLSRILTCVATMVIHPLCVSDCTVLCLAMWLW